MLTIPRLLETSLYVSSLEQSRNFYEALFGFEALLINERLWALSLPGNQVLLLFLRGASNQPNPVPGGVAPAHDGGGRLHLAFEIPPDELEAWRDRLTAADVAIETTVHSPRGGKSLYFRDPDGHLVELATPGLWPSKPEAV